MKQLLTFLLFIMLSFSALAQKNILVIGQTIAGATVTLHHSDSSLVASNIADAAGKYSFSVADTGTYYLHATAIGYKETFSDPLEITGTSENVNPVSLILTREAKQMEGVVVTAKKPLIEYKLDKTILNVDAMVSNTGSTALEALQKAPGVVVDKDGNISLKGKQGVVIMMDGKPTYMSGTELSSFLSGMPASQIDQIELMTNPSAKYDASGNSGIINIKTKKIKTKGFNGSASLSYGHGKYSKTNNSINLNYRINKFNFFTNVNGNYRREFQQLNINRKYFGAADELTSVFTQESQRTKERYNFNTKIGADYYASKNTTVGLVFTGYTTPGNEQSKGLSLLKNANYQLDSMVTANNSENNSWRNGGINLNIRHTIDTTGREISADVDIIKYSSGRDQFFDNGLLNADGSFRYRELLAGNLPSDINIYSFKTDYTQPLKHKIKLETGLKFSLVNTDNLANYYNILNEVKTIDWEKTNHFTYKENINAGYVNLSTEVKKWGFQLGLRAENTNIEGKQFGNPLPSHPDSSFTRTYTNLFPTTYVSYKLNDKNNFGFSYGRRINRPDYEDLNPFLFYLDKYTAAQGNPFLRPVYAHVFELTHSYNNWLNTTLNYSHSNDLISSAFKENGFTIVNSTDNFGTSDALSFSINANKKIAKWWTVMIYNEVNYQQLKGVTSDLNFNSKATTYTANVNNQFTFKKGWSAELSGFYRSGSMEGQLHINNLAQMDAGVKKEILKGKGSLKLGVRDLTGPMKVTGNLDFSRTQADFLQYRDTRVITLGFNYRFGKPIKGIRKRNSNSGATDEQSRVKGG